MNTVKISTDEYVEKKNKLKFLEFYWTEYVNKMNASHSYTYSADIELFIKGELYDHIHSLKVHSFTKRVTITKKNYAILNKYAYISDDLLSRL